MSRLLIGNFDFEYSLTHRQHELPANLRQLSDELACTWLAVAEPDDALLLPGQCDTAWLEGLEQQLPWRLPTICTDLATAPRDHIPTPWGWSDRIVSQCESSGLTLPTHPTIDAVRCVNSREFSTELENDLRCGLERAAWMTTIDEIEKWLAEYASRRGQSAPWVIKANLSNSSRERLLGRASQLTDQERAWLESRLELGGVAVEPWVEIVDEAGLQWDIPAHGDPQLIGMVPQVTDSSGHYRGSLFSLGDEFEPHWRDAVDVTRQAVLRIQAAGYFGPSGIDACRYRTADGSEQIRPLQDINARWTMGRLSLGWKRLLRPWEVGFWRHGPTVAQLRSACQLPEYDPVRVIVTSPASVGGRSSRLQHRVEIYRR